MKQLQKARSEIALNRIDETHPNIKGHRECTRNNPMPLSAARMGRWQHPENAVHETDYDSDYYIEYKCDVCGYKWKSEMPD